MKQKEVNTQTKIYMRLPQYMVHMKKNLEFTFNYILNTNRLHSYVDALEVN